MLGFKGKLVFANFLIYWLSLCNCFSLSTFVCASQIPQGQLHIAQVPQGEEVQITQDSEASVWMTEEKTFVFFSHFSWCIDFFKISPKL